MPGKYVKKRTFSPILLLIAAAVVLILLAVVLLPDKEVPEQTQPVEQTTQPTETTVPPEHKIIAATARFTVTGDLLMHLPVIESCWSSEKGEWIFDPIFTCVAPYIQQADYAVANLETTLRGENDTYPYQGNPLFNCPDGIASASKAAGFDMLLTGNNHCYDTRVEGVVRTLEVVAQAGLESLGTQLSKDDPDHKVIEVNGIKVGMTAYTFETSDGLPDVPSINAIRCRSNVLGMINSFDGGQLNKFYSEIGGQFEAMKAEGAEVIVVYMHWGDEYQLEPTKHQKKIAQKLCDMGVDVIIGGHPHVVQPADLLTSTEDENHKTLIIYSTGNAVSNQRIAEMDMKSGHTEDGILFHFTLARYIDGTVGLLETSCTPTWVYMEGYQQRYTILPLEYRQMDQWQELFGIDEDTYNACVNSYRRTMLLVYDGLEKAQNWCDEQLSAKFALLGDSVQ